MIPIYLKIEGLYSYQEAQEIDFQLLSQAQIFGIFGATGSGKSSILEAISFALYGQSARLNQQDKRGYNMMNLKSKRLYIEFDFRHADKRYKFCVEGKRNAKRFEQVGSIERKVYVYEKDQLIPSKIQNAEEITGLSYENFCRTIIIPQGKFQEFLQLTETERTRMLKEIFKLEKFELYPKTVSLERKNKENITKQETLLLQLEHITEEALRDMRTQSQGLENQLEEEKKNLDGLQKELNKLEEIKSLGEELHKQKSALAQLQQQSSLYEDRELKLKQYESCLVDFKPLLDKRQESGDAFDKNKKGLELKQEDRGENLKELEQAEKAFQEIKSNYEQREKFLKRSEEFESIISLKEQAQTILKLEERIKNGQEITEKMKRDAEQMKLDLNQKSAEIRKLREDRPDMDVILQVRDWFAQSDLLEKELLTKQEKQKEISSEIQLLKEEKNALLKNLPIHINQYSLETMQLIQMGEERIQKLQESHQKEEEKWEIIQEESHLSKLGEKLKAGENCPLCGSLHHPNPFAGKAVHGNAEAIKDKISEIKQQIQLEEMALLQLQVLADRETQILQKLNKADDEVSTAEQNKDKQQAKFIWKDFDKDTPEQTQKVLNELSTTDVNINLKTQEWEALEKTIDKEAKTLEKYLREIEKINKQRENERISFESQIAKLQFITYEEFQDKSNTSLEQLALLEKEQYKGMEDLYSSSEQRILKLRSRVDVLKGEIAELEKQEKQLAQKIAESNLQLQAKLESSAFESLEEIEALLRENIQIDQEKQAIHQFKQELIAAETQLKELEKRMQGKEMDEDSYSAIKEQHESAKLRIENLSLEIGGQRKEILRVEKELERKNHIEKELEKLLLRAEDIRSLKQLFARSGFVNYVSSIFLKNLCLAANERFRKLTRGSLSLEPTEGNSFEVRDLLNDGQRRSVKTLSGGQTFQAALSLAIALADQVQEQAKSKENFFFLDEGFGSLDQKSLHIIFQSLKALRKENRIVGIISHVEELHQEIDTYLQIVNDPENGSQIHCSWQ